MKENREPNIDIFKINMTEKEKEVQKKIKEWKLQNDRRIQEKKDQKAEKKRLRDIKKHETKRIWIPQVIACLMLLWALNPDNPYGYYIILRWVCCGIFAYLAFQVFESAKQGWTWVLGITALVYNPIFRVHLNRELWSFINVVTSIIALVSIFTIRVERNNQPKR